MTGDARPDLGRAMDDLAARRCPALGAALLTVSSAFSGLPPSIGEDRLDDLGRSLFGIADAGPADAARALAGLLLPDAGFGLDEAVHDGLLLDRVLEHRQGHPVVLAVVLAEAGRRAGVPTQVLSCDQRRWFCAVADGDCFHAVDTGARQAAPPRALRRRCAHEIAYAVLGGLECRYARAGAALSASRARSLRRRLPVAHGENCPELDLLRLDPHQNQQHP